MNDLLGELLLHLRIDATSIGIFGAGPRWGISTMALPSSVVALHAVLDESAILHRPGHADQALSRGDTILTVGKATVGFSSESGTPLTPFIDIWRRRKLPEELTARSRRAAPIRYGTSEIEQTPRLLTIAYVLDEPDTSPLISLLSDISFVPGRANSIAPCLPAILGWLIREDSAVNPGYVAPATKMAELILTGFIRDFVLLLPQERLGWLSALREARIGRVLGAMHAEPEKKWTLTALAQEANMSRALFASRFAAMLGKPPMAYLKEQRMKHAAEMISTRRMAVALVAEHFGYRSEAAFRTAFKNYWKVSPSKYTKS